MRQLLIEVEKEVSFKLKILQWGDDILKKIIRVIFCFFILIIVNCSGPLVASENIYFIPNQRKIINLNNTTLQLELETTKIEHRQFEDIHIKIILTNLGPHYSCLQLRGSYNKIFDISILNERGETVWNEPSFGLMPLYNIELQLKANSTFIKKYIWDQREYTGSGCVPHDPGLQVASGNYLIMAKLNLNKDVYGNDTLEVEHPLIIQEVIAWIVLVVILIAIFSFVYFKRKRKHNKS